MIEAHVDIKTTNTCLFCAGFTKKMPQSDQEDLLHSSPVWLPNPEDMEIMT